MTYSCVVIVDLEYSYPRLMPNEGLESIIQRRLFLRSEWLCTDLWPAGFVLLRARLWALSCSATPLPAASTAVHSRLEAPSNALHRKPPYHHTWLSNHWKSAPRCPRDEEPWQPLCSRLMRFENANGLLIAFIHISRPSYGQWNVISLDCCRYLGGERPVYRLWCRLS